MKRYCIVTSFILLSCISADPRTTNVVIHSKSLNWNWKHQAKHSHNSIHINLWLSELDSLNIKKIIGMYDVTDSEAALHILSDNYDIGLLEINNQSENEFNFLLNKMTVNTQEISFNPIKPFDLPKDIERMNLQGITKNFYNLIVITIIITAILAALILMLSTHTTGLASIPCCFENNGKVDSNKKSNEFPDEIWSEIFHQTNLKYSDMINDSNLIPRKSAKSGLIFFRKGMIKSNQKLIVKYQ